MSKKNITIHQVAALAQVAPITVSRVLNNSGYVSDEKRERVMQAAKQLNYTLHAGASELASRRGQARMLAVALPQLENPFFCARAGRLPSDCRRAWLRCAGLQHTRRDRT